MVKKNKKKIPIGDTAQLGGIFYYVQELFVADGVRWVRATYFRRKTRVKYYEKTKLFYDSENKYFTELEWLKLKKT